MIDLKDLKEVVADVLDMDEEEIYDDIMLEELNDWDSVNAVRLMMHMESALGVRLPVDRFMQSKSLKDLFAAALEEAVQ